MSRRKRSADRIVRAATQAQFWKMYWRVLTRFRPALRTCVAYTTGREGLCPQRVIVKTPAGPHQIRVHTPDDLTTVLECFGKIDYPVQGDERLIVDLGSNIGISALYFLTYSNARLHLFEPVPQNIERLTDNLQGFESRFVLHETAVGEATGTADFGVEPTGRYGGLTVRLTTKVQVKVVDVVEALDEIIESEGDIDVLKVDIEGLEAVVLERLQDHGLLSHIKCIYAELPDGDLRLSGTRFSRHGLISRFER